MVVIGLDQWTKYLVLRSAGIHLLQWSKWDIVSLQVVYNRGMALGIGLGRGFPFVGIGSLVIVAVVITTCMYRQEFMRFWYTPVVTGIVIGGIAGNLIDRMTRGGEVLDFIAILFFPVFNLADFFLVTGSLILIWRIYKSSNSI